MSSKLWLLLPAALIPFSFYVLNGDSAFFLLWWLAITCGGLAVWPLAARIFPAEDRGYLAAKAVGLLLPAFLLWQLSYLRLLPVAAWSVRLIFLTSAMGCWLLPTGRREIRKALKGRNFWRHIGIAEFIFGAALLLWTFARGLKPELDSLEKFMNIGFMNSIWRTGHLPALDMWLAGGNINYYYFGQYLYTYLARLTGIRPEIAYNLAMATTLAFTFTLAWAVVSRAMRTAGGKDRRLGRAAPICGGLLAGGLVTFAGNSHSFFFAENSPGFKFLNYLRGKGIVRADSPRAFWFADPTRFIGYNPETADKTIHEFPYYSFLVADLHAHVINLAMVLLLLLCLVYLLRQATLVRAARTGRRGTVEESDDTAWHRSEMRYVLQRFTLTARCRPLLLMSLLLAVFMMGNYWDFAIYLMISSLALLLVNGKVRQEIVDLSSLPIFLLQILLIVMPYLLVANPLWALFAFLAACCLNFYLTIISHSAMTITGAQVSWIFFLSHLLALPFNLGFEPISKQIAFVENQTPLWQLLILWGTHLLAGIIFLVVWTAWGNRIRWKKSVFPPPPEAREEARIAGCWPKRVFLRMNRADLFIYLLFAGAAGLLLLPELVYVVDIYSGDYKRANTMFKFTYQAFVLLSLVWSYGLARLIFTGKGKRESDNNRKKPVFYRLPLQLGGIALSLLLIIPAWYAPVATRQWLGSFSRERYRGIDGLEPLAAKESPQISDDFNRSLAADVAAIRWLNENISGQPVILESFGESYTDYCRVSAFTGLPTVIGWETHQWLWRTSRSQPSAYAHVVLPRQEDVRTIYTTENQAERLALLEQYKVRYIVVGNLERERFSRINDDGSRSLLIQEDQLKSLGNIIFARDDLYIVSLAAKP